MEEMKWGKREKHAPFLYQIGKRDKQAPVFEKRLNERR